MGCLGWALRWHEVVTGLCATGLSRRRRFRLLSCSAGALLVACPHDSLPEYFLHKERPEPPRIESASSAETMFQRLSKKSSGSRLGKASGLASRLARTSKDPALSADGKQQKKRSPWAPLRLLVSSDTAEISAPYNQPGAAEVRGLEDDGRRTSRAQDPLQGRSQPRNSLSTRREHDPVQKERPSLQR